MKPAPFELHIATSVDDAIEALVAADGEGKVLAGGQSLVALMNYRLARPEMIVDINRLTDLNYITTGEDGLSVGALTSHRQVEFSEDIAAGWPLMHMAMPWVAHVPIRNRGTIGGSIAHADAGSELCNVALALDAVMTVKGPNGEREIAAADFFEGMFMTSMEPEEILLKITFPPMPPRAGCAVDEVARRKGDFAMCGVVTVIALDEQGVINHARLAYLSMAGGPVRSFDAEAALVGSTPSPETFARAADAAAAEFNPSGDLHCSAEFRVHLCRVLTGRTLEKAFAEIH